MSETPAKSSVHKLVEAVSWSDKQMIPFRNERATLVREYAGPHYGRLGEGGQQQPLNLLFSVVTTLLPSLVTNPRVRITSKRPELGDFARVFQQDVNAAMDETRLPKTWHRGVMDAIFQLAALKIGLGPANEGPEGGELGNILSDPGKPFAETIDLDDLVLDMTARVPGEMMFCGNRYWLSFDWAMSSGLYDRDQLARIENNTRARRETKAADASHDGKPPDSAYFIDQVELLDLWIPSRKAIVTVAGNPQEATGYVREVGWTGPELGPYVLLGLADVPGNLMPLSVLGVIYDLYEGMNKTARKIIKRATNRKSVLTVAEGREKDGEAVRTADDGDVVSVKDVNQQKMQDFGGLADEGFKVVAWLDSYLNQISGRPDLMSGSGPQAKTGMQDQQNLANAKLRLAGWERSIKDAATEVGKQIAWYEWTDPVTQRDLSVRVPGLGVIAAQWTPTMRQGEFPHYDIEVNPFGSFAGGPAERAVRIRDWVTTVVIPVMAAAGPASGLTIDVRKVAEETGEDLGLDDAGSFFVEALPPPQLPGQVPGVEPPQVNVSHDTTINAGRRAAEGPQAPQQRSASAAPQPAAQPAGVE